MDVNLPSFEVLQEAGAGSERVLDNVERYALYVARVLQEGNMPDLTINQTGDNIGVYPVCTHVHVCVYECVCVHVLCCFALLFVSALSRV